MDLDRDAQRILDLAAEAHAPGSEDKARVEKKLGALLGVGAVAGAGSAATLPSAHAAHAASTASTTGTAGKTVATVNTAANVKTAGSAALKWWLSSAALATAIAGYVALSGTPAAPVPKSKAIATAPAPVPAKPPAEPVIEPPVAPPRPVAAIEAQPAPPDKPPSATPTRAIAHSKQAPHASTLSDELELLHRAQSAWRGDDAAAAMAALDQHRARFPRSTLRPERESLRVLALCELGKKAEAKALARKLIKQAPRSPLRVTIEESCALK